MQYQSIVILTGAGISAESGIQTFRAADGLWENHRVEDVASPEGFARDPILVQRFYNERRKQVLSDEVKANAAHQALGRLEAESEAKVLVVTQNIDDLHERGGSKNLIHMHGELLKMRCEKSQQVFEIRGDISSESPCSCCGETGRLRPDIVWFGEMPMQMEKILEALMSCDLFISIGTSGHVYPAAGFVMQAKSAGAHTLELNLEPSAQGSVFDEQQYGPATELVRQYVDKILAS
jgi:NAD-dependent deacetylase